MLSVRLFQRLQIPRASGLRSQKSRRSKYLSSKGPKFHVRQGLRALNPNKKLSESGASGLEDFNTGRLQGGYLCTGPAISDF